MSRANYEALVRDLCAIVGLPNATTVLAQGYIEVDGFEIGVSFFDNDEDALYLNYRFGTVLAGRTLIIFRLMLEANLNVYAQDQAQMGLESDTGGVLLIVRIPMMPDITGDWLAETLTHYTEHGRYWQENILTSTDELFEGICAGDYYWIKS